jgi:hypothetical protein
MTEMSMALQPYMAPVLIIMGLAIGVAGARQGLRAGRHLKLDPERALGILRGFRIGVFGLCLAGAGAGWLWGCGWLLGISLIICGEEVLESSIGIAALRHDPLIRDSPGGNGRPLATHGA